MSGYDDQAARRRALEPQGSFIVEAPAGSGKTELLTQRMLRLLDCVERPEQVLAITFTRKAAAEMRQRVIETLRAAASGTETVPEHRRMSVDLAHAVLRRSGRLGWSLIEQSQRLRIVTIDALNRGLARQLPLLTGGVVSAAITDNADFLYALAAQRTAESLADEGPLGSALRQLLEVADNSLTKLEAWLAGALQQRDRWIRALEQAAEQSLAEFVELNIARLRESRAEDLTTLAGAEETKTLHLLLSRRSVPEDDDSARAVASSAGEHWHEAAVTLLTAKGGWRQRFTKRERLGSDVESLRAAVKELQSRLQERAGLQEALAQFARLPPQALEAEQRLVLDALVPVLKRLLAELKLVFAASECVDHTELALAAQNALGAVDAPSDLLLALDRRIEHILVDEFQDTSHLQWDLLERLTAGWQSGDGRSLFLVGDPMQSIYRFRDADLSLFHRAKAQGLGAIRLEPVRLSVNFRSATQIVEWVNATFPGMFAASHGSAGPAFAMSTSGRGSLPDAGVSLEMLAVDDHDSEIARVVALVRAEHEKYPEQTIGILVRSRAHLAGLRAALSRAQVEAQAVEIDSLTDTSLGLDLIALTSALLHEGDRLAWLALLRSPCCGLRWNDLHALLDGVGERTIRQLIEDPEHRNRLSTDGRSRAGWLAERLRHAEASRHGLSLGAWIRECWLLIDGPAALEDPTELALADSFFRELDLLARDADLDDPATLVSSFARPSVRGVASRARIELMTIHRAKGLEFDTVVVPGLSKRTRGSESRLLLLQDISSPDGERFRLLAGASTGDDPLLGFLRRNELAEERQERARLLYVAATRAKRRLVLLGRIGRDARPHRDSLLALLTPDPVATASDDASDNAREESGDEPAAATFRELLLERMDFAEEIPWPPTAGADETERSIRPEFEWAHPGSVQVGTLIHRELQRLCERAAAAGKPLAPQPAIGRYRRELALLGIEPEHLATAAERVRDALESVWADPTGRRILHPWPEGWSELRLSLSGRDRIEHLQIDRSFVDDDGLRWIIDYKTGRHLGSNVDAFLESEVARYRAQLERYADAVAAIDTRPLRVGLYFPLLRQLRDWVPAVASRR